MGMTHFVENTDNDNINPSQQPSATNTPSRFLSDTSTHPQENKNAIK